MRSRGRVHSFCPPASIRREAAGAGGFRERGKMTRLTHANLVGPTLTILVLLGLIAVPRASSAYSVLTHEQIVDLLWKDQIQPLLMTAIPERHRRGPAQGACVCVRRLRRSGHGLLPVREQALQRSRALRAQRRFRRGPDRRSLRTSTNMHLRWERCRTTPPTTAGTPPSIAWWPWLSQAAGEVRRPGHLRGLLPRPTSRRSSASTWFKWRRTATPPIAITTSSASKSPGPCSNAHFEDLRRSS